MGFCSWTKFPLNFAFIVIKGVMLLVSRLAFQQTALRLLSGKYPPKYNNGGWGGGWGGGGGGGGVGGW